MAYAQKQNGSWVELFPSDAIQFKAASEAEDGTPDVIELIASYETVTRWTEEERAAVGLFTVGEGESAPVGQRIASSKIKDVNGRPVCVNEFEPIPQEEPASQISLVEAEKVRRIEAGFPFAGKLIQSRSEDRENIAGAKSAAQDAKLLGAEPGELDWQKKLDATNGAAVFAWITADNSMLPLDADSMIAMGYAAMLHKQRLIFVAKGIKDRIAGGETIPDVTADALWSMP